jgi:hypothetical protein
MRGPSPVLGDRFTSALPTIPVERWSLAVSSLFTGFALLQHKLRQAAHRLVKFPVIADGTTERGSQDFAAALE